MFLENAAQEFLRDLMHSAELHGVRLSKNWDIDHLCYRVETLDRYRQMMSDLARVGVLLAETPVNGRMIATFELNEPIDFGDYRIDLIELPAPKPGKKVHEGFEHIEIVCDQPFDKLIGEFEILQSQSIDRAGGNGSAGFTIGKSGLEKTLNQELEIRFLETGSAVGGGTGVGAGAMKFHHLSLASVIRLENNRAVAKALQTSRVLTELKRFGPLIAGTFPLGVDVVHSDMDVLVGVGDFPDFKWVIEKQISARAEIEALTVEETQVENEKTIIVRFRCEGLSIEIFAQSEASVRQRAYRHFLIEEKILKYGGPNFREEILSLRTQGLKTEPAFAKALGLSGDPFLGVLKLQELSIGELRLFLNRW